MSPELNSVTFVPKRFPRVSGDEPFMAAMESSKAPFSPRERG